MGRFPGEDSCLTLVWAVLDLLITHQTNGIRFKKRPRSSSHIRDAVDLDTRTPTPQADPLRRTRTTVTRGGDRLID